MAAYDLEEQEQIDDFRAWWQQHGGKVAGIVLAAAVVVASWQGWSWYQGQQAIKAGVLFGKLHQALLENQPQQARALAGELMEKYGGTHYASLGALLAARSSFDTGDLKTVRAQLEWAVKHGAPEVRDVARLRLAGVLLDEKAYDEALQILVQAPNETFAPAYAELKADILLAQGKREESRAAYKEALALLETQAQKASAASKVIDRTDGNPKEGPQDTNGEADGIVAQEPAVQLLQLKLDALGGA
ncbi:MAG: tetratricopeptide repeat protein [Zoogloeaceae bacterium]|jgi:predicted negative regulator of RcsB-dependent stress response|nr:tetratricopeptide repeat protein [Zoogloeaceae bacterium]